MEEDLEGYDHIHREISPVPLLERLWRINPVDGEKVGGLRPGVDSAQVREIACVFHESNCGPQLSILSQEMFKDTVHIWLTRENVELSP
jgi:hypothetical protein